MAKIECQQSTHELNGTRKPLITNRGGLAFMNAFMNHECRAPQGHLRTSVQLDFLLRAPAARAIELVRMACRVFNRDPCVCTY
jgi:hypothetical protein